MAKRPNSPFASSQPAISSSHSKKKKKPPTLPKKKHPRPSYPLTPEHLAALLTRLASATAFSFRFLSCNDLLLHPSQSLTLDSSLFSAAVSLSSLHSIIRFPSPTPPPASVPDHHPHWFRRFLLSATSESDPRWVEAFRMSRRSFHLLLKTVTPSLPYEGASSGPPPEQKLAAALFRLAHAAPFRSVARLFGFDGPSASCRAFYEVCKAVADSLGHLFELPSDLDRISQGFRRISLPGCCGVIGFNRFFVEGKTDLGKDGSSIIVQAVVDTEGRFLDVSAGWSGLMSPAQILPGTRLFSCIPNLLLITVPDDNATRSPLPGYLLGDSCCPLLPWLITPFRDPGTPETSAFNEVHERAMELVVKAFGGVRARWRLLLARWKEDCIEALPFVIITGCLLHNFLLKCSEPSLPSHIDESERVQGFTEFKGEGDGEGDKIRRALASQLKVKVTHK